MVSQPLLTWAAVGIILAGYLHYVVSVINQICAFLGINCLTIPVPSEEVPLQKASAAPATEAKLE